MPYKPFGGATYTLGSSISSTQNTILLSSFLEPVSNIPYTMALLGTDIAYGTIAPKTSQVEFISFTGITQNDNGSALLTGVTRGLNKKQPYEENTTFKLPHSGQSIFIISDAPQVFVEYAAKENDEIITGKWSVPDPTQSMQIANKEYVDAGDSNARTVNVVDTTSDSSGNVQVSTITSANPLNISGINTMVLIQVSTEQAQTITGITVGGVAAAVIAGSVVTDTPNNLRSEQWFLVAPPVGAQPIVITLSGAAYISFGAEALENVNQASPIGTVATPTNGSSTTPLVTLTTASDNSSIYDSLTTASPGVVYTVGIGQTAQWQETAGTRQGASSSVVAGTEPYSVSMKYTLSASTPWVYTAVEINPVVQTVVSDHKVSASSTDSTFDFLNAKIQAGSGIALTLIGSSGNPQTLQITATGGSGTVPSEQNLGGIDASIGDPTKNTFISALTSDATGATIFNTVFATQTNSIIRIQRFAKDVNTGTYYRTDSTTSFPSFSQLTSTGTGIVVLGTKVYVFGIRSGLPLLGSSYDVANLGSNATLSFSDSPTITVPPTAFTDGTFIYIQINGTGTFRKYSVSGTTLTFVANITGGMVGATGAYMQGSNIYMTNGNSDVQVFTISGTAFVAGTTINYRIPSFGANVSSNPGIFGLGFISATVFYFAYQLSLTVPNGTSNPTRPNFYIKAFTLPV